MKRQILLFLLLSCYVFSYADDSFDKTVNYQFNNAKAYIGETLYVMTITGSGEPAGVIGNEESEYYPNFMNYYKFDDDIGHAHTANNYKFDPFDDRDSRVAGTHKRHLEGHRFYVDNVKQVANYNYKWILYLTDLDTGEKVKFIYDSEYDKLGNNSVQWFIYFPFYVKKHLDYCKSLVGTKLVFATDSKCNGVIRETVGYYRTSFKKDINTGEAINYTEPYVKWTIKKVGIDVHEQCIYFIVSDGKNTTKVYYSNEYAHHHPKYNIGNRVFPEKIWNELVEKYGEKHMSLIMQTEMSDDMTTEEKYMAGGRKFGKYKNSADSSSDLEALKKAGEDAVKSAKETIKDGAKALKGLFK